MPVSPRRLTDWDFAYQVRPVLLGVGDRRHAITPHEAQLLLGELGRLPKARHRAAEETATDIVQGLAAGCAVELGEDGRRCVLRAIEGVRARRGLTPSLARLRELVLHSPDAVV